MTQFQVRPTNEAESTVVQRAMFALGYQWDDIEEPTVVKDMAGRAILAFANGYMTWLFLESADDKLKEFPLAKIDKLINEAEKIRGREPAPVQAPTSQAPFDPSALLGILGQLFMPKGGLPGVVADKVEMRRQEIKPYTPFWMVYRDNGGAPVKKHWTQAEAEEEAMRLAKANHGHNFFVLSVSAAFMASEPVVHTVPRGEIDNSPPF